MHLPEVTGIYKNKEYETVNSSNIYTYKDRQENQ